MYSTCIFCNARLGTNAVVEEFPVGRRLAFDPQKGRLWALCPSCRQWNLSRWEALESLERLYRGTPTRYSTEEIGLARHREGLELVRIGRPTRPEYAAWRYGGELLRRRRRAVLYGSVVAAGAVAIGAGAASGLVVLGGGTLGVLNLYANGMNVYRNVVRDAARVALPSGEWVKLKTRHVQRAVLAQEEDAVRLEFPYVVDQPVRGYRQARWALGAMSPRYDPVASLAGDDAIHAAGRILPALSPAGASRARVRDAARFVEQAGSIEEAFSRARRTSPSMRRGMITPAGVSKRALYRLPGDLRLGLEMAVQEARERRALEGELSRLEAEWREAEAVAAIADDLLLPDRVRRLFDR